jgi:lysophospholipase L1-like esterase
MKHLLSAVASLALSLVARAVDADVVVRGKLDNARHRFETQKAGHVAFLGGSITEMDGYRPMVCELLQKRFPDTQFTFTPAGVSSTCSTTGAFRLQNDVLSKGPVDLLFVEYAVNDDQDAHHTREECIRGMEGVIRRTRLHNPNADIVMTFFLNESSMQKYNAGRVPLPVAAHSAVAEHYQVSTVNLAKKVSASIAAGDFDWKKFGGVHPAPFGNRIAADMIGGLFDAMWSVPSKGVAAANPQPPVPLDQNSYFNGRFVDPSELRLGNGWTLGVPDWKKIPGGKRERFTTVPCVQAQEAGAELEMTFSGTSVGAYVVAGPDAGMLEASVDGGSPVKVNVFHDFSKGLHYPRTVLFGDALPPGKHTLKLRVSEVKDERSAGHAVRVLHFVVNGER